MAKSKIVDLEKEIENIKRDTSVNVSELREASDRHNKTSKKNNDVDISGDFESLDISIIDPAGEMSMNNSLDISADFDATSKELFSVESVCKLSTQRNKHTISENREDDGDAPASSFMSSSSECALTITPRIKNNETKSAIITMSQPRVGRGGTARHSYGKLLACDGPNNDDINDNECIPTINRIVGTAKMNKARPSICLTGSENPQSLSGKPTTPCKWCTRMINIICLKKSMIRCCKCTP